MPESGGKKHELLAPAGSYEIAKAVIASGADAVYLAGQMFGARAYASNLTQERLKDIIDYAHVYGCQIHMTVNTLLKNLEIQKELYDYIEPLYAHGLDAVIVQDFGVFRFLHDCFPQLKLHASTQMSVASAAGAVFLKEQGASRIVTAREISLEEIRTIKEQTDIEIEAFIHGALCYSYSGQCLMSSLIGGRSGNRGRCAQPCRLAYDVTDADGKRYRTGEPCPLSMKDLCGIELLPDLCAAGIDSFKIEGRMKQLEYAAGVTKIYRQCLDRFEQDSEHWRVKPEELKALSALGNREGFTRGYYYQRNGADMLSARNSAHHSGDAGLHLPGEPTKIKTDFMVSARIGRPFTVTASAEGQKVTVTGAAVQKAEKNPMTGEELKKRMGKTGGTPFAPGTVQLDLEENVFLPVSAVNEVRREALNRLQQAICGRFRRKDARNLLLKPDKVQKAGRILSGAEEDEERHSLDRCEGMYSPVLRVQISRFTMLRVILAYETVDEVLLDYADDSAWNEFEDSVRRIHEAGKKAVYCFPYICRKETQNRFLKKNNPLQKIPFDYFLVRSYDSLGFALNTLKIPAEKIQTDSGLYVFSVYAAQAFRNFGISGFTISQELNHGELQHQDKNGELQVYGRQPLMISAQCVYKNYDRCRKDNRSRRLQLFLKERTGQTGPGRKTKRQYRDIPNYFPVKAYCADCYNVIYNSRILNLLDRPDKVKACGFDRLRISFTDENEEHIGKILNLCRNLKNSGCIKSGKNCFTYEDYVYRYTHGHFKRGVE